MEHNIGLITSMAAGSDNLDLDSQHTDLSPLLMAQSSSVEHEHIVNICSTSNPFVPSIAAVENEALFQRNSSQSVAQQEDPPSGSSWFQGCPGICNHSDQDILNSASQHHEWVCLVLLEM